MSSPRGRTASPRSVSPRGVTGTWGSQGNVGAARQVRLKALFGVLDTKGEGRLNSQEVHRFAEACGFNGSALEWEQEWKVLCDLYKWDEVVGVDQASFERFVDDEDSSGYCKNSEIDEIILDLQRAPNAKIHHSATEPFLAGHTVMMKTAEGATLEVPDLNIVFFNLIDRNRDGVITLEEWEQAISLASPRTPRQPRSPRNDPSGQAVSRGVQAPAPSEVATQVPSDGYLSDAGMEERRVANQQVRVRPGGSMRGSESLISQASREVPRKSLGKEEDPKATADAAEDRVTPLKSDSTKVDHEAAMKPAAPKGKVESPRTKEESPRAAEGELKEFASQQPMAKGRSVQTMRSSLASIGEEVPQNVASIEAGVGDAVHGLVFVLADGSRRGTVMSKDQQPTPASSRDRLGSTTLLLPDERIVRVSGHRSTGDGLASRLVIETTLERQFTLQGGRSDWQGEPFSYQAEPGHEIVGCIFGGGQVTGIEQRELPQESRARSRTKSSIREMSPAQDATAEIVVDPQAVAREVFAEALGQVRRLRLATDKMADRLDGALAREAAANAREDAVAAQAPRPMPKPTPEQIERLQSTVSSKVQQRLETEVTQALTARLLAATAGPLAALKQAKEKAILLHHRKAARILGGRLLSKVLALPRVQEGFTREKARRAIELAAVLAEEEEARRKSVVAACRFVEVVVDHPPARRSLAEFERRQSALVLQAGELQLVTDEEDEEEEEEWDEEVEQGAAGLQSPGRRSLQDRAPSSPAGRRSVGAEAARRSLGLQAEAEAKESRDQVPPLPSSPAGRRSAAAETARRSMGVQAEAEAAAMGPSSSERAVSKISTTRSSIAKPRSEQEKMEHKRSTKVRFDDEPGAKEALIAAGTLQGGGAGASDRDVPEAASKRPSVAFREMDVDGDGQLTEEEIIKGLQAGLLWHPECPPDDDEDDSEYSDEYSEGEESEEEGEFERDEVVDEEDRTRTHSQSRDAPRRRSKEEAVPRGSAIADPIMDDEAPPLPAPHLPPPSETASRGPEFGEEEVEGEHKARMDESDSEYEEVEVTEEEAQRLQKEEEEEEELHRRKGTTQSQQMQAAQGSVVGAQPSDAGKEGLVSGTRSLQSLQSQGTRALEGSVVGARPSDAGEEGLVSAAHSVQSLQSQGTRTLQAQGSVVGARPSDAGGQEGLVSTARSVQSVQSQGTRAIEAYEEEEGAALTASSKPAALKLVKTESPRVEHDLSVKPEASKGKDESPRPKEESPRGAEGEFKAVPRGATVADPMDLEEVEAGVGRLASVNGGEHKAEGSARHLFTTKEEDPKADSAEEILSSAERAGGALGYALTLSLMGAAAKLRGEEDEDEEDDEDFESLCLRASTLIVQSHRSGTLDSAVRELMDEKDENLRQLIAGKLAGTYAPAPSEERRFTAGETFRRLDIDGDGTLSVEEIIRGLKEGLLNRELDDVEEDSEEDDDEDDETDEEEDDEDEDEEEEEEAVQEKPIVKVPTVGGASVADAIDVHEAEGVAGRLSTKDEPKVGQTSSVHSLAGAEDEAHVGRVVSAMSRAGTEHEANVGRTASAMSRVGLEHEAHVGRTASATCRVGTEHEAHVGRQASAAMSRVGTEQEAHVGREASAMSRVGTEHEAHVGRSASAVSRIGTEHEAHVGREASAIGRVGTEQEAHVGREASAISRVGTLHEVVHADSTKGIPGEVEFVHEVSEVHRTPTTGSSIATHVEVAHAPSTLSRGGPEAEVAPEVAPRPPPISTDSSSEGEVKGHFAEEDSDVLQLVFEDLDQDQMEHADFKPELTKSLSNIGVSQVVTETLTISVREGCVAELCGPRSAIRQVKSAPLQNLSVFRTKATVLPDPESAEETAAYHKLETIRNLGSEKATHVPSAKGLPAAEADREVSLEDLEDGKDEDEEEDDLVELAFEDLDYHTADQQEFKSELNKSMASVGVSQDVISSLRVALRDGSIIAEIRGTGSSIRSLRSAPLNDVSVWGCQAYVLPNRRPKAKKRNSSVSTADQEELQSGPGCGDKVSRTFTAGEAFHRLDADGDGVLTEEEIIKGLQQGLLGNTGLEMLDEEESSYEDSEYETEEEEDEQEGLQALPVQAPVAEAAAPPAVQAREEVATKACEVSPEQVPTPRVAAEEPVVAQPAQQAPPTPTKDDREGDEAYWAMAMAISSVGQNDGQVPVPESAAAPPKVPVRTLTPLLAQASGAGGAVAPGKLVVMSLNLQYFASYPFVKEKEAQAKVNEATGGDNPPDVVCVQEGLAGYYSALESAGFDKVICAGEQQRLFEAQAQGKPRDHGERLAQSVRDMVYEDAATLKGCREQLHEELLCNQLYIRRGCEWEVVEKGAKRISSDLRLKGGGSRVAGMLATRSMVWAKLRRRGTSGPCAYVMCTHLTGGRFEDQYFVQQLAQERIEQPRRIIRFYEERQNPSPDDIGIMVGDFNAAADYDKVNGAMHAYYRSAIVGSEGVQSDAKDKGIQDAELEQLFGEYMTSPFKAIRESGWTFAYGKEVGVTSGFGHLIDHMAMSRRVEVEKPEVVYLTNQKFGSEQHTNLPITDHNAIKATFVLRPESWGASAAARSVEELSDAPPHVAEMYYEGMEDGEEKAHFVPEDDDELQAAQPEALKPRPHIPRLPVPGREPKDVRQNTRPRTAGSPAPEPHFAAPPHFSQGQPSGSTPRPISPLSPYSPLSQMLRELADAHDLETAEMNRRITMLEARLEAAGLAVPVSEADLARSQAGAHAHYPIGRIRPGSPAPSNAGSAGPAPASAGPAAALRQRTALRLQAARQTHRMIAKLNTDDFRQVRQAVREAEKKKAGPGSAA